VNTLSSDNKTEREVDRKRAGLSFVIINLGVPWALRPNSPVFSRSCPKRVLVFFRRELPHKNGATIVRLPSFYGGESGATQTFLVPLPNNLPYPGRCELVQKLRNLVSTESCMLKSETVWA